jgi:glycosyltransferase involved in cell wall biosynthesis
LQGAQVQATQRSSTDRFTAHFVESLVRRQPQILAAVSVDGQLPPPAWAPQLPSHVPLAESALAPARSANERLVFHALSVLEDLPLVRIWPRWAQDPAVGLVVTVHDMTPLRHFENYLSGSPRHWRDSRYGLIEQADAVIVTSHATANDLTGVLCVDPRRVFVASGGVSESYLPSLEGRTQGLRSLRPELGIEAAFLLTIGNVDSLAVLATLIRAYASLPSALSERHQLVVICSRADRDRRAALREEAARYGAASRVVVTSDLDEATMLRLYQGCYAFVFPCLGDTFGLPVMEATSCGAPTIVGDIAQLREIVSDPEARFDPLHEAGVALALHRVLTDERFVESRRLAGLRNAARYSLDVWEDDVVAAYGCAARRRPCPPQAPAGVLDRRRSNAVRAAT